MTVDFASNDVIILQEVLRSSAKQYLIKTDADAISGTDVTTSVTHVQCVGERQRTSDRLYQSV